MDLVMTRTFNECVAVMRERIAEKRKTIPEKVEALDKDNAVLPADELVGYQNAQARGFAEGKLRLGDAQAIHNVLNTWTTAGLAERVIVLMVMDRLLGSELARKTGGF